MARIAQPMATLDQNAIAATGATTMGELLQRIKPLTQSADGSDPIFLLNGQRTSGYEEIASLPPEALDKVEVLPEGCDLHGRVDVKPQDYSARPGSRRPAGWYRRLNWLGVLLTSVGLALRDAVAGSFGSTPTETVSRPRRPAARTAPRTTTRTTSSAATSRRTPAKATRPSRKRG